MTSDKTFFGHPRGLATLFFTEMWERFSYYGMRAMLLPFMIAAVDKGGMGFNVKTGGAIYALYTMFAYLLALPGGWLADNFLGLRRSIFIGGCIIATGHFCLAYPSDETFFVGLLLIVLGTGLLKPNISSVVGELYSNDEQVKRDNGFSIFYMGINLGGFIGPLICGQLRQGAGWHYGFAAAGVGMILGLIQYKLTEKNLGNAGMEVVSLSNPEKEMTRRKNIKGVLTIIVLLLIAFVATAWMKIIVLDPIVIAHTFKYLIAICVTLYFVFVFAFEKLDRDETKKVAAIALVFVFTAIFYAGYEGQGSSLNLFAVNYTNMNVGSFVIPFEWLQSLPSLFIFIFVPCFAALWLWLAARKQNPITPVKISLGLLFMGLGYLVMVGASYVVTGGDKPLPTWLAATYMLHTFGEICLYPIGMSGVTKLSPKRLVGRMMGVFFMALALGNLMAGIFAGELEEKAVLANPHLLVDLFQGIAIVMIVAAGVVLILMKPLRNLMGNIR